MKWQVSILATHARLLAGVFGLLMITACNESDAPITPQTPAERGMALVAANGCTACHALSDTRGIGPGWGNLYGSTRRLKDGRSVVADEAYLRRAMREPAADIVDGFDNVMVPAAVSDAQMADIIALIRELGN